MQEHPLTGMHPSQNLAHRHSNPEHGHSNAAHPLQGPAHLRHDTSLQLVPQWAFREDGEAEYMENFAVHTIHATEGDRGSLVAPSLSQVRDLLALKADFIACLFSW